MKPWIVFLLAAAGLPAADPNVLWYAQPAKNWNEALPIGNGRLGAMVFGGVAEERLQLNEGTVWAGEKRDRVNPAAQDAIPVVRRLLFEGKVQEAEQLADKAIISIPRRLPPYQALGDLRLKFRDLPEPVTGYRRELDIGSAIARVSYGRCTREVFSSAPDQVLVMRIDCGGDPVSFSATMSREADASVQAIAPDRLLLEGDAILRDDRHAGERKVGMHFQAVTLVRAEGGTTSIEAQEIRVEKARRVTLYVAAATNFRGTDPAARIAEHLRAAGKSYPALKAAHIADFQQYFRRVTLHLGDAPDLPTDERLRHVAEGGDDPALVALYFQFGRYLLISSSRPGGLAATLQGIWNDKLAPPWDSKFTININTEMNYWPAETTNLSEMTGPLFDLIDMAREDGRHVAKTMYGARGFVLHHNTDIWGDAVPIDGVGSGIWPMGAAWLSLHLWDHYEFTRDVGFLRARAYPVMKEAAEFFVDTLTPDPKTNYLVTGPSISPENTYITADGAKGRLTMGPYMDTEILYALFTRLIAASEILNIDSEFRDTLRAKLLKLPPLKIGKYGQLLEWLEDYQEAEPGHRHTSHLFALHPGDQITVRGTPDLAQAARVTLERRLASGGGHTGWSRAWIINFWARLEDADEVYANVMALLRKSTLPNLLDTHPPFQIDGNFGGTAGIAEALLQSHAGEITLLPALPAAWPEGSVSGLRARGGVTVDLRWSASRPTQATLHSGPGGKVRLRPPHGQQITAIRLGASKVPIRPAGTEAIECTLQPGLNYEVVMRTTALIPR